MRSVNTSLVVILPILSLLLFGGATLKDFAFAMLIGVVTGAYSSIFVATPILVILKEREPRYQQLRARLETRGKAERRLRAVPTNGQERRRGGAGGGAGRGGRRRWIEAGEQERAVVLAPASQEQATSARQTPAEVTPWISIS